MVWKPSEKEEEHFARLEFERKKKLEGEKHKKFIEGEKERLKDLHYMDYPRCGMEPIEIKCQSPVRETCTLGLSGGWRLTFRGASSDPTVWQRMKARTVIVGSNARLSGRPCASQSASAELDRGG